MKTIEPTIEGHKVVSRDEWIAARKELLAREKEQTRLRDQLAAVRSVCRVIASKAFINSPSQSITIQK